MNNIQASIDDLKSSVPEQYASSWEQPILDARHVPMTNKEGAPLKGTIFLVI